MADSSYRPDPDALLKSIKDSQRHGDKAHLRVFLGMSPGVGKTYAMLRAAKQAQEKGQDVVIGVVETHGRSETAELVHGFEVIPPRSVIYKKTTLVEMDLDAIIRRRPKIVLVDELAHTNAPGSRHEKRYQDVLELLDQGIEVYTTLNIQHLESRKESVESITGIRIHETVPDSILDRAHLVEIIDISPIELLKRLRDGKIYLKDVIDRAENNFFREDKLTALREISLRITAERVDQDLQRMTGLGVRSPWQTNERLLVAVSHSPYSETLLRAGRRIAYNLEAPWVALHVDNGQILSSEDQKQLKKNIEFARELGAELVTMVDTDTVAAIARTARVKNVTQILIGRPGRQRWYEKLWPKSLLDQLLASVGDIDIHVLRSHKDSEQKMSFQRRLEMWTGHFSFMPYWYTLCFLVFITGLGFAIQDYIGYRAVGFVYLLGVLAVGTVGSLANVMLSALLSFLLWNFFFIPPLFTLVVGQADDMILCLSYFIAALITGSLTQRIRSHEMLIRLREDRTRFLYEVLKDINTSHNKEEFISKVTHRTGELLNAECDLILCDDDEELGSKTKSYYNSDRLLAAKDKAVADWAIANRKRAGWSTDTLSESRALYLPMKSQDRVLGVFTFVPNKKSNRLSLDEETLLDSVVQQLTSAIERGVVAKRLALTQRLEDSEKLYQTLLNSISHEIRTPLTAIVGSIANINEILSRSNMLDSAKPLLLNLKKSSQRLNRVVENLLDMTRINSGHLDLNVDWQDINDLAQAIELKVRDLDLSQKFVVRSIDDGPMVKFDFRLIEHALLNLINNAGAYSQPDGEILLSLQVVDGWFELRVDDQGPGVPEEFREKIFDKFFRLPNSKSGGIGLGLSLVKSIVELHGGSVKCEPNLPRGSSFRMYLPLSEAPKAI